MTLPSNAANSCNEKRFTAYPTLQKPSITAAVARGMYNVTSSVFGKVASTSSSLVNKIAIKPTKHIAKWYWKNLPANIPQAAAASTIYVFAIMLFFSGNPFQSLVAGVALAGLNSVVHSLSIPFMKKIFLDEKKQDVMSVGLRIATIVAVGVVTSVAFSLLSVYFPPLGFFAEINLTFTIGMLLVSEAIRGAYLVLHKFVDLDYSTLRARPAISV